MRFLFCFAALAIAALPASQARSETISDLGLNDHCFGDPIDREDLAGRVVVVDYWGVG